MMAFALLDLLMINGMPLRKISVVEARRWGYTHDRDGRFLELLLYGVPDQGTVGDYVADADVDKAVKLVDRGP